MYYLLLILLITIISASIKWSVNYIDYSKLKRMRSRYNNYWFKPDNMSIKEHEIFREALKEDEQIIIHLFEKTNIDFPIYNDHVPLSNTTVQVRKIKVQQNIFVNNQETIKLSFSIFDKCISVYKLRMKESISIRYWVKLFLNLPNRILSFFNFKVAETDLSIIFRVLWWIFNFILALFNDEIKQIALSLFS